MSTPGITTIESKSFYLIPKSDSLTVTGDEIISNIKRLRLSSDTIIKIKEEAAYRFNDRIVTGKEILTNAVFPKAIEEGVPNLLIFGTLLLGFIIGWNLYFINRYRKRENIAMADLTTVISALAGAAILTLLKFNMVLVGVYGIGIFLGFASYFALIMYAASKSSDPDFKFPNIFLKVFPDQQPASRLKTFTDCTLLKYNNMRYLQKFEVGRYYKNSGSKIFTPDSTRKLEYYDPNPDNYPDQTDPDYPMKVAMKAVLKAGQSGAWFLTTCNFDDISTEPTANKYIPIFWPVTDGGVIITNQGVAAPCPPFCQGDTGLPPSDTE